MSKEEEKKPIKYKGKVKTNSYIANPDLNESYMILNTQFFEEEISNSQIKVSESNLGSNEKLLVDNSFTDAKIIHRKKRKGD